MKFNYQARTKTGEIQVGEVEASSKEAALALLQKYGLYVTILEEAIPPVYAKRIKIFERISKKDVVLFSRQLSIMFKSKVPLVEALTTLASQTKNPDFREKIFKLSEAVEGGTAFSKALSLYPKIFSPFYIAMVKSGEAAGRLAEVLEYLADHLEREYYLYSRMRGAMIYPSLVLLVVIIVLVMMIFFIIPHLSDVLKETGQEIPPITAGVIGFCNFLKRWVWLILIFLVLLIFSLFRYSRTDSGKRRFDKFFLKIPILGDFLKRVYLSRFAENFSTLISGGLPISQALEITGEIVGNTTYKDIIFETREGVMKGMEISSILKKYPDPFPPVFSQMVMVGEKTGTLDRSLLYIVSFYQKEINRTIDDLLGILEPVLVIILGGIVAILMASVLMPLYQMGGL